MQKNNDYPYEFDSSKCATCEGNCCIGESGYIWISQDEIINLANHLKIDVKTLFDTFLFEINNQYSIREKKISKNNFACAFFDLDKKQCSIYEARPAQCKSFPFWEYFKENVAELKAECPGIKDKKNKK